MNTTTGNIVVCVVETRRLVNLLSLVRKSNSGSFDLISQSLDRNLKVIEEKLKEIQMANMRTRAFYVDKAIKENVEFESKDTF
ncbi:MAG: hypothetical protein WC609_01260 [Candidatus Paceibacterota bacterium]|jgi:hypothetical protein